MRNRGKHQQKEQGLNILRFVQAMQVMAAALSKVSKTLGFLVISGFMVLLSFHVAFAELELVSVATDGTPPL